MGQVDGEMLTTQRILDAVPLLSALGALGGWASAFVQGVHWLDGVDRAGLVPVPVHVGAETGRSATQVRFVHDLLDEDDVHSCQGVSVTSLARTAFDVVRWSRDLADGLTALDAMLHFTTLSLSELDAELDRRPGWRGIQLARDAAALADAEVLSPWESRLRAHYVVDAGLPKPLVNPWVFDHRWRLLGRPDLLDPTVAHATEYDGAYHETPDQRVRDDARQRSFTAAGVVVTRVNRLDFGSHAELTRQLRHDHRAATIPLRDSRLFVVPAGTTTEIHGHQIPLAARRLMSSIQTGIEASA